MNKAQLNALYCALMTLRGNGGGFSPSERERAITELQALFDRGVADASK